MTPQELRDLVRKRRDGMPERERLRKSDEVWKRLVEVPAFQTASSALFYVSVGSEVETGMMRTLARELGMVVACPRSKPGDKSMRFHVLASDEELSPGAYGILQPAAETPPLADLKDAVVLVPGMVYDRQGHRLGFGSGYYDRWLAGEGKGLPTIGLAFHEQLVDLVPTQPHDVDMDWVVTDKEAIECK